MGTRRYRLSCPLLCCFTQIIEVIRLGRRKFAWGVLEAIKEALGCSKRNVWPIVFQIASSTLWIAGEVCFFVRTLMAQAWE